ncbi:hypothetical protein ABPG72_011456 [Tetrahymena utriculariae]
MNTYMNTDSSYYSQNFKKQRIINFSSSDEQVIPRTDDVMFRQSIVYEKNRELNVYRKYLKIDEAFSQLGGMFNALLSIGFVICSRISQLELNRKLLNSIFNISDDGKNQEDLKSKKNILSVQKSSEKCKIQYHETILQKIITYDTNKLYNHIDIFYIVNKLVEVEKLKHLLPNENQIKIFQYLPRPKLRIEEINLNENKDEKEKNTQKEEHNSNYQIFITNVKNDKIIQMSDIKLVNLFKENSFDLTNNKYQFYLNQLDENNLLSLKNRSFKKSKTQSCNQTLGLDKDDVIELQKFDSNSLSNSQSSQYSSFKVKHVKEKQVSQSMIDFFKENDQDQIQYSESIQQTDQNYFPRHIEKQHRIEAKNLEEDDT